MTEQADVTLKEWVAASDDGVLYSFQPKNSQSCGLHCEKEELQKWKKKGVCLMWLEISLHEASTRRVVQTVHSDPLNWDEAKRSSDRRYDMAKQQRVSEKQRPARATLEADWAAALDKDDLGAIYDSIPTRTQMDALLTLPANDSATSSGRNGSTASACSPNLTDMLQVPLADASKAAASVFVAIAEVAVASTACCSSVSAFRALASSLHSAILSANSLFSAAVAASSSAVAALHARVSGGEDCGCDSVHSAILSANSLFSAALAASSSAIAALHARASGGEVCGYDSVHVDGASRAEAASVPLGDASRAHLGEDAVMAAERAALHVSVRAQAEATAQQDQRRSSHSSGNGCCERPLTSPTPSGFSVPPRGR